MTVIGVTGTIGSGKSTVCRILADLGCPTIDADRVAHATYRRGTPLWKAIVERFGPRVQHPSGAIDRRALGLIVFNDAAAREWLNNLVHPATRVRVESRIEKLRKQGHRCAAVEAPLLVEAGWADFLDQVWLVVAPDDTVVRRLERDRGQSAEATRSRLSAQTPGEKQRAHADTVIVNDGDMRALRSRVAELLQTLPKV